MLFTILGFGLLILLAIAMLPVPRVRRLLLTATARLLQAIVLAFLGACGTFFVQPDTAPVWVSSSASALLEGTIGLGFNSSSGWPWLVLAVLSVWIALPVLIVVDLAAGLSRQSAIAQSLRKEMRFAAA